MWDRKQKVAGTSHEKITGVSRVSFTEAYGASMDCSCLNSVWIEASELALHDKMGDWESQ